MVQRLKEATEIDIVTDLGIDYFEDPAARLAADETEDAFIPTGWEGVDRMIGGGIGRQELITFLAPSGGGKSVGMLNLGINLMTQGLHGVYISLEMRDKKVARRTDQMIARISSGAISSNQTQVATEVESFHAKTGARFFIKRMREGTTNANHIIAYLRELEARHGFRPDWVIVDYMDLMEPVQRGAGDNMFVKDKYVSQELRAIGMDYNCIMISASQLGKHATTAIEEGRQMHQGDVQGGSSKTNTSDLMIALVKTDAMHEAGEYRFEFVKSRNSDANGKNLMMRWNKLSLRISDVDSSELVFKPKGASILLPQLRKPRSIDDLLKGKGDEPSPQ
jgi:replicative DNA helicase